MAQVQLLLYDSPYEGASVAISYDSNTLKAQTFVITVPDTASTDLVITWAINFVQQPTITAHRGSVSSSVPLQQTLTGVVKSDRGGSYIDFGFTELGFGFAFGSPLAAGTKLK